MVRFFLILPPSSLGNKKKKKKTEAQRGKKTHKKWAAFNVITVLSISTCAKRSQPTELCRRRDEGRCPEAGSWHLRGKKKEKKKALQRILTLAPYLYTTNLCQDVFWRGTFLSGSPQLATFLFRVTLDGLCLTKHVTVQAGQAWASSARGCASLNFPASSRTWTCHVLGLYICKGKQVNKV